MLKIEVVIFLLTTTVLCFVSTNRYFELIDFGIDTLSPNTMQVEWEINDKKSLGFSVKLQVKLFKKLKRFGVRIDCCVRNGIQTNYFMVLNRSMDFCRDVQKRKGSDFILSYIREAYTNACNTSLECPFLPMTYYFKDIYVDPNKLPGYIFSLKGEIMFNILWYNYLQPKGGKIEKLLLTHGKVKYGNK